VTLIEYSVVSGGVVFEPKNDIHRLEIGKIRVCGSKMKTGIHHVISGFPVPEKSDLSLLHSVRLRQFCSQLFRFFWFALGFAEVGQVSVDYYCFGSITALQISKVVYTNFPAMT
jgi:hypothetical protein